MEKIFSEENATFFNRTYFCMFERKSSNFFSNSAHILTRFLNKQTYDHSEVLFENVTREDADKSVKLLIKYLFNYGFYKFGVEITLIMLVILISFRRDVVSAVYVIWLCILFVSRRRSKHFFWPIFLYFIVLFNIVQYASLLNLPLFLEMSKSQ